MLFCYILPLVPCERLCAIARPTWSSVIFSYHNIGFLRQCGYIKRELLNAEGELGTVHKLGPQKMRGYRTPPPPTLPPSTDNFSICKTHLSPLSADVSILTIWNLVLLPNSNSSHGKLWMKRSHSQGTWRPAPAQSQECQNYWTGQRLPCLLTWISWKEEL